MNIYKKALIRGWHRNTVQSVRNERQHMGEADRRTARHIHPLYVG